MLFPGRPLGVVISIGLGRYDGDSPDTYSEDIADQVERAGGTFIRLNPLIDNSMGSLTTDGKILDRMEQDVIKYMATSEEAQRAKTLLDECLKVNPAIRGRYVSAECEDDEEANKADCSDDDDTTIIPSLEIPKCRRQSSTSSVSVANTTIVTKKTYTAGVPSQNDDNMTTSILLRTILLTTTFTVIFHGHVPLSKYGSFDDAL